MTAVLCPPRPAYADARYSRDFDITSEELAWLVERMTPLQEVAAATCTTHIKRLCGSEK